ncbi:MAG: hypothetical protein WC829_04970 [Hyphomicrobium sp.]|jgi:hypothetical protein
MSNEAPSHLHGLSIADKISKLTAFISDDLDARAAHGMHVSGGCYLLIARSPESPVAQALRSHAARMSSMGIRLRAIFCEVDQASQVHLTAPYSMPSECRLMRDPRLLAAHEQLLLSPTRSWVGDCMRREPGKRDALELYAADCAKTGSHAGRSFEGLWRTTTPIMTVPPLAAALAQMPELASGDALPQGLRRQ